MNAENADSFTVCLNSRLYWGEWQERVGGRVLKLFPLIKVYLMFPDQDFDPEQALTSNETELAHENKRGSWLGIFSQNWLERVIGPGRTSPVYS
jgi:hypothetical protein